MLTTYSTLEYDYRIATQDRKVTCQYCGRGFKNDSKLAFHNKWFCGPHARRSAAQSKTQKKSGTLLTSPSHRHPPPQRSRD